MAIISIILPVFVIIILGWLFRSWNLIKKDAVRYYYLFVRYIAAPALLILSLGSASFDYIWNWKYIVCFSGAIVGLFVVATYVLRVIARKPLVQSAFLAAVISTSNVGYFGLPIVFAIFGRKAIVPAAVAIIVQMIVLALSVFIFEVTKQDKEAVHKAFNKAVRFFFVHPLVIAIIVGVLYSLTTYPMPDALAKFLHLLELAVIPVALFTIGFQVDPSELGRRIQSSFLVWFFKLVLLPLIVLWACMSFGVTPIWTIVAVVCAGLPYASSIGYLGEQYAGEKNGKLAHLWGPTQDTVMILSFVTLFVWLVILAQIYPCEFRSTYTFF